MSPVAESISGGDSFGHVHGGSQDGSWRVSGWAGEQRATDGSVFGGRSVLRDERQDLTPGLIDHSDRLKDLCG